MRGARKRTRAGPVCQARLNPTFALPPGGNKESNQERKHIMQQFKLRTIFATLAFAGYVLPAWAFDSGSTGADGAFSPTVNTQLQIPESGVFNFTTVNIPAEVTVTFLKNTTNTPVVMLASGNVTVAGVMDLSGKDANPVGSAGDGNLGDDGLPGSGGVGGYDGGRGGSTGTNKRGGSGLGPGGGMFGGQGSWPYGDTRIAGGGGGFGSSGSNAGWGGNTQSYHSGTGLGGAPYGSSQLLPLLGGSGGGGGAGGNSFVGGGGGGGGGAVLIASSGTVSITGTVRANGGKGGLSKGPGAGAEGGSGSGGAIRIVATAIAGNGSITATGTDQSGSSSGDVSGYGVDGNGGAGGTGRIRLEAETFTRTAASNPVHSFGSPSSVFVAGLPTLRITSVAGVNAPASPTGNADITLPSTTPNPVTVAFSTTGVPVGNTVTLRVTPAYGDATTVVSPAITGSTSAGTASVSVSLPTGPSVLSATTTYTIVTAMGEALSVYAQGETVEKVRLTTTMNGPTMATLITVSGREFDVPHAALAMIQS